jgi:hypothetical protein
MAAFPKTATLEEEIRAFYSAIGTAMTQWQCVEEQLAVIFCAVVSDHPRERTIANAAFHAVINFNTKLAMIDAALATRAFMSAPDRETYSEWRTLKNRAAKRADRRNEMAHFALDVADTARTGHRCYLAPNKINVEALVRHQGKPPRRTICAITAYGSAFQKMGDDLQAFYSRRLTG